ncbi:hypothetical protein DZF91_12400 [Actinomadura logoneensis]|uniref:Uncharacterized protein n=1 Tax=Actinomadura logoneensis TaxID=2293572 RepID=A0A372JMT6_9ACTN|nr:hypothetical protein [Actinomadura logoneensis]RFU41322.1 hypothetical protein DZF91_12400 [Actinomadura logoneensis]
MSPPPPPASLPAPLEGAAAAQLAPHEKPNPEYRELYRAYSDAYGSIDALRNALDGPVRTLNGTDAWIGPESRTWGGQLETQRAALRKAADQILWDIYNRLASTQRTVVRV